MPECKSNAEPNLLNLFKDICTYMAHNFRVIEMHVDFAHN
jgi:hypothetical protein